MVIQAQEILKRLVDSPQGRKIATEMDAERLTKRVALADEIKSIRAAIEAKAPGVRKAAEKAQQQVEVAWEAYQATLRGRAQARTDASNSGSDRRITTLEGELRSTADMETISVFLEELDEILEGLRHGEYTHGGELTGKWMGSTPQRGAGNHAQVSACIQQVMAVRREVADQVRLEPLTQAELKDRLDGLRQSITLPN